MSVGRWTAWLPLLLCLHAAAADAPSRPDAKPAVDYAIVVTGGELLAGEYADGHTQFLTRTLRPLGLRCVASVCVDDRPDDLKAALRFASGKAKLVIVTGGLGPTDNDITRETLAQFTGVPLREHPEVLAAMARRFGAAPNELRKNLRRQTRVPTRGTYLPNGHGTAVGLVFDTGEAVTVALPGPPRELQAMATDALVPYLARRFGTRLPGPSLTLRFVGLGQSRIDQTLKDHVRMPPGVTVASQFAASRVDFTFSFPNDTPDARAKLDDLKRQILKHLGDSVYSVDDRTLEQVVVERLESLGATLALAEVGSGGSLAAGLSAADTRRQALAGAWVASSDERLRRLLRVADANWASTAKPEQRMELLASAAAEATSSQWALVVGQPEQDGATARRFVVVGLRMPDGRLDTRRFVVGDSSPSSHARLATQLLDYLRRRLPPAE